MTKIIRQNKWKETSCKILNPGRRYFLNLRAMGIQSMSSQKGQDSLPYARKDMIMTGLTVNTNEL